MKFSFKDVFCKCDQIHSFLRIRSHLLKTLFMENFIFCAVYVILNLTILACGPTMIKSFISKQKKDTFD